jgi:hypothetical protein
MFGARCWPAGDSPAPFMPNLSFKSYSRDGAEGQGEGAQPIQPIQPEEENQQTPNGYVLGNLRWLRHMPWDIGTEKCAESSKCWDVSGAP